MTFRRLALVIFHRKNISCLVRADAEDLLSLCVECVTESSKSLSALLMSGRVPILLCDDAAVFVSESLLDRISCNTVNRRHRTNQGLTSVMATFGKHSVASVRRFLTEWPGFGHDREASLFDAAD